MLFNGINDAHKFVGDCSSMILEAKRKAIKEPAKGKGLKILTPKQMLQTLPIVMTQVKAGNTFKKLLNEIRQFIYSLYQSKEITKRVCNNIMNSIKVWYKNEYYIYEFGK